MWSLYDCMRKQSLCRDNKSNMALRDDVRRPCTEKRHFTVWQILCTDQVQAQHEKLTTCGFCGSSISDIFRDVSVLLCIEHVHQPHSVHQTKPKQLLPQKGGERISHASLSGSHASKLECYYRHHKWGWILQYMHAL